MKRYHAALLCSFIIFGATLAFSAFALPDPVASHFDLQGQPRGWVTRETYQWSMGLIGYAFAAVLSMTAVAMRASPPELFSMPHRDYWLSPERRSETNDYFMNQLTWLASISLIFMAGLNCLVVSANRSVPVRLSELLWVLIALYVVAVHIWAIAFIMHFSKRPQTPLPSH